MTTLCTYIGTGSRVPVIALTSPDVLAKLPSNSYVVVEFPGGGLADVLISHLVWTE